MSEIVVGKDDKHYVRILTRLEEVHNWKSLAENLQKRYPRRWRVNKRTLCRARSFHQKARRVMEDFARKVGKWLLRLLKILMPMLLSWRVLRTSSRMLANYLKSFTINST